MPDVRVGQIWQDWDTRYRDRVRLVEVKAINGAHAECDSWYPGDPGPVRVRSTRIRLERFRPTGQGYKLYVGDPAERADGSAA